MPRQQSVRGAYGQVGSSNSHSGSCVTRCLSATGIILVVVLVMSAGSGDNFANQNKVRSGQAYHTEADERDDYDGGDKGVHDAVSEAVVDIERTEENELSKSEATLSSALSSTERTVRTWMTETLEDKMSSEEVENMVTEVEEKLEDEVNEELRYKADELRETEVQNIDDKVEADESEGYTTDVHDLEKQAVAHIRDGINQATTEIKKSLLSRAQLIEKEILEQRLSAKLHKKVTLVIEEEELGGIEELFNGLDKLATPDQTSSEDDEILEQKREAAEAEFSSDGDGDDEVGEEEGSPDDGEGW